MVESVSDLAVQDPPGEEFSAADLRWVKYASSEHQRDDVALIPYERMDAFIAGECSNPECPTRFHIERGRKRDRGTLREVRSDDYLLYRMYVSCIFFFLLLYYLNSVLVKLLILADHCCCVVLCWCDVLGLINPGTGARSARRITAREGRSYRAGSIGSTRGIVPLVRSRCVAAPATLPSSGYMPARPWCSLSTMRGGISTSLVSYAMVPWTGTPLGRVPGGCRMWGARSSSRPCR